VKQPILQHPQRCHKQKIVQSLEDYIRNEVYKLCGDEEIKLKQPIKHQNHDYRIRIFETKQRISSRQ
jgi:hypothetical protein